MNKNVVFMVVLTMVLALGKLGYDEINKGIKDREESQVKALVEFYFANQHEIEKDPYLNEHISNLYENFKESQYFLPDSQLRVKQILTNADKESVEFDSIFLFSERDKNTKQNIALTSENGEDGLLDKLSKHYSITSPVNKKFTNAMNSCRGNDPTKRLCYRDIGYLNVMDDIKHSLDTRIEQGGFHEYWAFIYGDLDHRDSQYHFSKCQKSSSLKSVKELMSDDYTHEALVKRYGVKRLVTEVEGRVVSYNFIFISNDTEFGYLGKQGFCDYQFTQSELPKLMSEFWLSLLPDNVFKEVRLSPKVDSKKKHFLDNYFLPKTKELKE